MPCPDEASGDVCGSEIHFHADAGSDNADEDFCSPFCGCNCCQTIFTNSLPLYTLFVVIPSPDLNSAYTDNPSGDYQDSLYHPPKA